jgi:ribosome-binding protein aMBF1 (putative translation factor)
VPAKSIEPFYAELGRSIQTQRAKLGWSQESLGATLRPKVTRASIANIEAGKQRVLTHTLVQIADALGVDLCEIVPKDGRRKSPVPTRLVAQLAEHNVPTKVIKQLSAQLTLAKGEK